MSHGPYLQLQQQQLQQLAYNEEGEDENGLKLTLSHMAKMAPYPSTCLLPTWDHSFPLSLPPPPLELTRRCKKPRINSDTMTPNQVNNGKQSNPLRKLQFRDHVQNYKQKFGVLEALEEPVEGELVEEGGMRLVQLLISCAEAVACRDRAQASTLLHELKANALVLGTSFQRVASCFVQGLSDRLALVQPLGAVGIIGPATVPATASGRKEEALALAYELCPYLQFGHFVANASILEAFEGENLVHVVDLGMTMGLPHGHQWRKLIDSLADRTSPRPRRIRITGVGAQGDRLKAIGNELEFCAQKLGINLEFFVIERNLENFSPEDLELEEGEVLVVNSMLQLHCVVKESRGALNSVLQMIHELSPRVLVLVEQDASHNGPFFLGRFMEALHYYSAIFDSLDAMLPRYDTKRAKVEQFYFAEEIKNIVSCEGPARVERHERVDQWRRRMSRAGFQPAPIKRMAQAKQWLDKVRACEGYTIAEEKGCLVLGWKSKPIIAASCWKC
ncbi:GRAS family protein RAD1 [Elaeis guineensis]|uniref:DELLA protein RGL1 n=1 Tax=Elaeis guineensis var. tenera TaxID=51953 RepID=A0A6I9RUB0_ELAGV|nr:DELLA protein RGL1 [Elaeis guineensis]